MIITFAFLFTVLLVPIFRGQFWKLGAIKLERRELIFGALLIQTLIISVVPGQLDTNIASALHLASYALAIGFVWFNRNVFGMPVIVLGGLLNALVIGLNDGIMPARIGALETAGLEFKPGDFENSAPVEDAKLWFLGDVFAIPESLPFSNVFSIGDVLLILGGAITVHVVCGSKLVPARWRAKVMLNDAAHEEIEKNEIATAQIATPAPREATATAPLLGEPVLNEPVLNETAEPTPELSTVGPAAKIAEALNPTPEQPATPDVAPPISMTPAPTLSSMFAQNIRPLVHRNEDIDVKAFANQ